MTIHLCKSFLKKITIILLNYYLFSIKLKANTIQKIPIFKSKWKKVKFINKFIIKLVKYIFWLKIKIKYIFIDKNNNNES